MEDRPARPLLRHGWSAALGCLLAGNALVQLFPFFRSLHWGFALFENFALQHLIALVTILAAALVTKRRRIALAAGLLLLPVLFQLSYYFIPQPYAEGTRALRTVSFNVLTQNPHHDEALRFLQQADADVIALVEISEDWLESLAPLLETHPHIAHFPARHNFGLGLFSRFPIVRHTRPMPTPGHPLLIADLDCHGSLVTVMVAHPVPPMGARASTQRERYLKECVDLVRQQPAPVLLMGDLNATPWSPLFEELITDTGLQDTGRGRGYQATWNRRNPLFALPIDHVLHSTELTPLARRTGPTCGSDHSPIVVDFALEPTIPTPEQRPRLTPATPPKPPSQGRLRRVPDDPAEN